MAALPQAPLCAPLSLGSKRPQHGVHPGSTEPEPAQTGIPEDCDGLTRTGAAGPSSAGRRARAGPLAALATGGTRVASWWALLPWAQVSALVCVFLVAVPWPPGEFFPFGPQSVCLQPSQHRLPHSPHLSSFPASSLLPPLPLFPPPPSTSQRLWLPFPPYPRPPISSS